MSAAHDFQIKLSLTRADFALSVDLALPAQGITVLFGPSGSGKTTLLRCVAGLENASGVITLPHAVWQDSDRKINIPTWQREIGYVFQEASLFEHLDVRKNLHFGLKRVDRSGDARDLDATLELLGISHLLERPVTSLSGGERQRVAIARALATRPKLLLLDEPLASLDVGRRQEVLPWLERMHDALKIPVLYVTHSADELARLADYVVMLDQGRVQASGAVTEAMASREVALAIGEEAGVLTVGEIAERSTTDHMAQVRFGAGVLWGRDHGLPVGQTVRMRVLARDVSLARSVHDDSTIQNRLQGVIASIDPDVHPSQVLVRVRCENEIIMSRVTVRACRSLGLEVGQSIWCLVKAVAVIV